MSDSKKKKEELYDMERYDGKGGSFERLGKALKDNDRSAKDFIAKTYPHPDSLSENSKNALLRGYNSDDDDEDI